ncbi:MAG: adenosylcobalamin-dependent ribonucleoside-diphosphate reductase [Planctomycetota bacterium]|nr:adenosylcobalamin-dependent ribonucleoside-diphosphate reductase [Planctomycetota bacterium]
MKDRMEKLKDATRAAAVPTASLKPVDPIWENGKALGLTENSIRVLMSRYLKKGPDTKCTETPHELFMRVAHTGAAAEAKYGATQAEIERTEKAYYEMMIRGVFMPNSPTLMNAGREMGMLSACFVLPVGDSIDEIFDTVKATALIQKAGGGTGFAFDRLRPTGDWIKSSGGTTSGPISFWKVLSEATNAIQQGAFRRGANMGMMKINHPDILKFIFAKQDLSRFQNYNISVKVPDAWMEAYRKDATQPHVVTNFRTRKSYVLPKGLKIEEYQLNDLTPLEAYQALAAGSRPEIWTMADIWDTIVNNAWQTGEPGVIFIDRINQFNPTPNVGEIEATNPCGEQPLLPYEACNLGSVNLGYFVRTDPHGHATYDWDGLRRAVHMGTRFLEGVIDVNNYVIPQIEKICTENRKIGLGIMGFADALYKLGVGYDTPEGVEWGERFMKFVNDEAHNESERLAETRGVFKNWKGSRWELEWKRKQRNAACTTVAPTGTISILANCSGGVEPLFSLAFFRNVLNGQRLVEVNDEFKRVAKANHYWGWTETELFDRIATEGSLQHIPNIPENVKRVFVCAHDISPDWHIRMQAAFQKHCDSSISKTTNFRSDAKPEDVRKIYSLAYDSGCKGVTVYRDGCRKGQPMALKESEKKHEHAAKPPAPAPAAPVGLKPVKTATILSAVRIRQNTPFGHMHVTITVDPKSEKELEVFAQLGKAGDVAASDLEAICRMVSLFLRSGGSLDLVMDQLEGIGCYLSVPSKEGRVMSLGDALGKTLRKYWQAKKRAGLRAILLGEVDFDAVQTVGETGNGHDKGNGNGGDHAPGTATAVGLAVAHAVAPAAAPTAAPRSRARAAADELLSQYKLKCPECGGGTLAFVEGCTKCQSCGYSRC